MTARWHEALDGQAEAFAFFDSPRGRGYVGAWVNSWGPGGQNVHSRTGEALSPDGLSGYRAMVGALPNALLGADTLYVEPEMMDLVDVAARSFEPEPLLPTDLPCPVGFLYLPRPLAITDRNGKSVSARAFAWRPLAMSGDPWEAVEDGVAIDGIALYMLHRVGDHDDYSDAEHAAGGHAIGPWLLTHLFPWPFGAEYPRGQQGSLLDIARPLIALWRLMQQTIAMTSRERPPRATRRRVPPLLADRLVTVVKLRRPRRPDDPDHEPTPVEWTHRWIVGGHWRQQWYPSLNLHRQVWIAPYVKGPEHLPLDARKARVFDLAR